MKPLTADGLRDRMIQGSNLIIVNVLKKEAYMEKHIPGSINIPLDKFENIATTVMPDKKETVIVYCANEECQASPKAAKKLDEMGYEKVYDFEAGIEGWEDAGYKMQGTTGREKAEAL